MFNIPCWCQYDISSELSFLPLRSDHVRIELGDDDGDVVAVHAGQLLGQREHLGQPLVVHRAKLAVPHGVPHQVGRCVLVLEGRGHSGLPLLEQPLHLSQSDFVASDFERLALMNSR